MNNKYAKQEALKTLILSKYKDKRIQKGVNNVFDACIALDKQKCVITKVSVAEHLAEHFDSKPALGTLNNDKKDVYTPLIDSFVTKSARQGRVPDTVARLESPEQLYADKIELEKKIKRLNRKNQVLEDLLNKNFRGVMAESGGFSTRKYLLEGNTENSSIENGLISTPTDTEAAIEAFVAIYKVALEEDAIGIVTHEDSSIIVEPDTGTVVLDTDQTDLILKYVNK